MKSEESNGGIMICNVCLKKEAHIHFEVIIQDGTLRLSLCEACARKKGLGFNMSKMYSVLAELSSGRCGHHERERQEALPPAHAPAARQTVRKMKNRSRLTPEQEISRLSARLDQAVKREEFEKAAELRDRIEALKKTT